MGLFSKIKNGLTKTRTSFSDSLGGLFNRFTKIDEELFDELEEILILSDIGFATASDICEQLRLVVKQNGLKDPSEIKTHLHAIIMEMVDGDADLKISTSPSVILVIGVNGVGKTTTIGKLA